MTGPAEVRISWIEGEDDIDVARKADVSVGVHRQAVDDEILDLRVIEGARDRFHAADFHQGKVEEGRHKEIVSDRRRLRGMRLAPLTKTINK